MAVTRQAFRASHPAPCWCLPEEEGILPAMPSQGTWSDPFSEPLRVGIAGCGSLAKPLRLSWQTLLG